MARVTLTDRFIGSRKPAPSGSRVEFHDALVPGLTLRITDTGHKSFVLVARYPTHPKNPTRRALCTYGAITLEKAREKPRHWLDLIGRGIDPEVEAARVRAAARTQQANTFAAVSSAFLDRHGSKLAKEKEARRIIESEFVSRWGTRPVTEIRGEEIATAIRAIVDRDAPYQAHNALGYIRRLFNWVIGTQEFAIEKSPVDGLKPLDLIGPREARERTLTDGELRAVWSGADSMAYPYGPIIRLLILTGLREREVGDAEWSEFDLERKLWTIPACRMKGKRAGAHEVPLTPAMLEILHSLPRFTGGDFVFSTTAGAKPVNGYSKSKARIDRLSSVAGWKFHDLRRTMRTHLSALPVQDLVRELVIAHAKPGLHKIYDRHAYQDEKRECLGLWEQRLLGIVNPL
jgi:integrase